MYSKVNTYRIIYDLSENSYQGAPDFHSRTMSFYQLFIDDNILMTNHSTVWKNTDRRAKE